MFCMLPKGFASVKRTFLKHYIWSRSGVWNRRLQRRQFRIMNFRDELSYNYRRIDSFVVTTSIFTLFEHFLSHTISFIFNLRVSVRLTLLARRKSSVPSFHFRWTFLSLSSNICWRMGVSEPFLSLEVLCMHNFVFWIDLYFEPGVGWRDFSSVCSDCVVMLSSS